MCRKKQGEMDKMEGVTHNLCKQKLDIIVVAMDVNQAKPFGFMLALLDFGLFSPLQAYFNH